jgi:ribonuclease BN (tRNA processing enzyme)
MNVIFLGTNGWYDSPTGHTVSVLVATSRYHIVFDAGSGFAQLPDYLAGLPRRPLFLLLSHFHLDHIIGLHTLVKLPIARLVIAGPPGTRAMIASFVNSPYTVPLSYVETLYPVRVLELPEEHDQLPFKCTTLPLLHESPTLGYRVELGRKVLTYCTDTGYCENAVTLARKADLLITDCAYRVGELDANWPHLNPGSAAALAVTAGAKALVLTHFDASRYRTLDDRQAAEYAARKIFPQTTASTDGMAITI